MTIPTHITISDVLRGEATMTPQTLALIDNVTTLFENDGGARTMSVFAQMYLTSGLLRAWLVHHSHRLSENDDICESADHEDVFSRAKMTPVLSRIVNNIHKEKNYILADTVQYLLAGVSGSVLSEICHGFIEIEDFTSEFLLTYDLPHYCD